MASSATQYGVQFEALMAEVCRDFGRKLIKSWDTKCDKEEVVNFVNECVDAFFSKSSSSSKDEEVVEIKSPVKPKAKKVSKKKSEPEPEPEVVVSDNEAEITDVESPKKKGKGKAKAKAPAKAKEVAKKTKKASSSGKPKCQATTAKGTPCSKCALEGEVFCNVHLKKVAKKATEEEAAKPKVSKGKGGKGLSKTSPKHTHGLTSPPLKECELCDTHGMPFEIPEYEEDEEEIEKKDDPDFKLTEDDFDESENEVGSDLDEEAEFDELD